MIVSKSLIVFAFWASCTGFFSLALILAQPSRRKIVHVLDTVYVGLIIAAMLTIAHFILSGPKEPYPGKQACTSIGT